MSTIYSKPRQAKPRSRRAGFDQIREQREAPVTVTFTDGAVEAPARGSWRHCELAVAAAHAAVRDVVIRPFDLGRSILIIHVAKGYRRERLIERARSAVTDVLGLHADVQVEISEWMGSSTAFTIAA